jgi:hypothetical protein
MFDDIERRRLLVQPAGEDPVETALGVAHVELDEGAGKLLRFPGRARLARPHPHHHVADPDRLAGLHLEVARDAVSFVQQADHRHPLRHRRRPGRDRGHRLRRVDCPRLRHLLLFLAAVAGALRPAGGQRQQADEEQTGGAQAHPWSGVQA